MTKLSISPPLTANRLLAAVLKKLLGELRSAFIVKVQIIIQSEWVSGLMGAKNGNATIVVGGLCCLNIAANSYIGIIHISAK